MGFITDALGLTNYDAQDEANALAKANAKRAEKYGKEAINYYKEHYEKWNDIFGGIQEDLGTYFKDLTGDIHLAKQLTELQKQQQLALSQMDREFASRGLAGSGLQADAIRQTMFNTAITKANAGAMKDDYVAQQKMAFLQGVGLPEYGQINAGISNAYATAAGVAGNMSGQMAQIGQNYAFTNNRSTGGLLGLGARYFGIF